VLLPNQSLGGGRRRRGQTFAAIEEYGRERWLDELAHELKSRAYQPRPVRRVYIPKPDGDQRQLFSPVHREVAVEFAVVLSRGGAERHGSVDGSMPEFFVAAKRVVTTAGAPIAVWKTNQLAGRKP
jgi:hypothetical protein